MSNKKYKIASVVLDRWVARLRDPGVSQCFEAYFENRGGGPISLIHNKGEVPSCACALGHLGCAFAGEGDVSHLKIEELLDDDNFFQDVTDLNDVTKLTLPQIADWLEANVERV